MPEKHRPRHLAITVVAVTLLFVVTSVGTGVGLGPLRASQSPVLSPARADVAHLVQTGAPWGHPTPAAIGRISLWSEPWTPFRRDLLVAGDMGAPVAATPIRLYFPAILGYTSLPDLVVQGMRIELETEGSCSFTSSVLGLRVTVANMGDADAGAFVIDANGRQQTATGLAAGRSTSVWFPRYLFVENSATVDATSLVAESNEENNTLTQILPLPTPPPPCTATPTPTGTPTPTATPTSTSTLPSM